MLLRKSKISLLSFILLVLILPSCRGAAFSPADAAVNAILENNNQDVQVDENSVQVRQTNQLASDKAIVVLSFNQTDARLGPQKCLTTYEVNKTFIGWMPQGGSQGCWGANNNEPNQPDIDVMSGFAGGNRTGDNGVSHVIGLVNNPAIVKVKVTWNDNVSEDLDLVENSFISYRVGQFTMKSVDGLDENGDVVYSINPEIAPGKQNQ